MDNITLANTMLANTLRDSLVENAANGRFKTLVNDVLTSPKFRKALNAAEALFGTTPVRHKRVKKVVKATKRAMKKAAKVVDPNAPKAKRGRPKGSKNKPKVAPTTEITAESRPAILPENEGLSITLDMASETV